MITRITEDTVLKAWLPTEQEWLNYYSTIINRKTIFSIEIQDIIFKHYNTTVNSICAKYGKVYSNVVGWMFRLTTTLEQKGFKIKREKIWRFLKENNLKSPTILENEKILEVENRTRKSGVGFKIASDKSKEQELKILNDLEQQYGKQNIKYQQPILFLMNDKYGNIKTFHKHLDFLIFVNEKKIKIIEAKLSEYNVNDIQRTEYLILLKKIFPQNEIEFEYNFDYGNDAHELSLEDYK